MSINEKILTDIHGVLPKEKDLNEAEFYGISYLDTDKESVDGITFKKLAQHRDIYDMLLNIQMDRIINISNYNFYAVITTGWAASLNENGELDERPSLHPQRRRVKLIITIDAQNKDISSIVEFSDDPDNLLFDHDNATGSLKDAIKDLLSHV